MTHIANNIEAKFSKPKTAESRRVSFQVFYKKYIAPGENAVSGVKYEYNNGIIEKTETMKIKEQYIAQNLIRRFSETKAYTQKGFLSQEVEIWTSETQWRKPDLCFLTKEQIMEGADEMESIPRFVIEVISTYDPINIVNDKVLEYFKAGVKVLWHIFPKQQMVYVFKSMSQIAILRADDICSAAPVIPDFEISVNDIFKKD